MFNISKMKKWLAFTMLLLCTKTYSQNLKIDLWPEGKIPLRVNSLQQEKIEVAEVTRISKVQIPQIEVFLPNKRSATGQGVIICPGGGYARLSYDWEGTDFAKLLNAHGIAAFVLKYRLPDSLTSTHPDQVPLLDAKQAIRMVRSRAKEWNINPNKVGVMGFSAGGHLAATLSTQLEEGTRPNFAILVYPVISMDKAIAHAGSRNNLIGLEPTSNLIYKYSNEFQVSEQTPPSFIVHATDDNSVPVENSLLYYQALKKNKVSAEMHIFPTGGHGFGLGLGKGALEKWPNLLFDWLAIQK
jgi:acetyl esterase/lipase